MTSFKKNGLKNLVTAICLLPPALQGGIYGGGTVGGAKVGGVRKDYLKAAGGSPATCDNTSFSANAFDWSLFAGYMVKLGVGIGGELRFGQSKAKDVQSWDLAGENLKFNTTLESNWTFSGFCKISAPVVLFDFYALVGFEGMQIKNTFDAHVEGRSDVAPSHSSVTKWSWGPAIGLGAQCTLGPVLFGLEYTCAWLGDVKHVRNVDWWIRDDNTSPPAYNPATTELHENTTKSTHQRFAGLVGFAF